MSPADLRAEAPESSRGFTNQKPFMVTTSDVAARWSGVPDGLAFRCGLCGYRFAIGDTARWVYAGGTEFLSFFVCSSCEADPPDALTKWKIANEEARQRFWWLFETPPFAERGYRRAALAAPEPSDEAVARELRLIWWQNFKRGVGCLEAEAEPPEGWGEDAPDKVAAVRAAEDAARARARGKT